MVLGLLPTLAIHFSIVPAPRHPQATSSSIQDGVSHLQSCFQPPCQGLRQDKGQALLSPQPGPSWWKTFFSEPWHGLAASAAGRVKASWSGATTQSGASCFQDLLAPFLSG